MIGERCIAAHDEAHDTDKIRLHALAQRPAAHCSKRACFDNVKCAVCSFVAVRHISGKGDLKVMFLTEIRDDVLIVDRINALHNEALQE